MPLTPFLCLDKCEHCLSGADVGSYFLPKKITHQHSWIQNCSPDWEARGPSSCSSRSPGSCCDIQEAAGAPQGLAELRMDRALGLNDSSVCMYT